MSDTEREQDQKDRDRRRTRKIEAGLLKPALMEQLEKNFLLRARDGEIIIAITVHYQKR